MGVSESLIDDDTVDLSIWDFMNLTKPLLIDSNTAFSNRKICYNYIVFSESLSDVDTVDLSIWDFINLDHTVPGRIDRQ